MIYLDYASTTPILKEVFDEMKKYFLNIYANPSSLHSFGQKALKAIDQSRLKIKNLIEADYLNEIIFTSSATESNNLAIKGLSYFFNYRLKLKPHIISSEIEHPSVLEVLKDLKKNGLIEFDLLSIDKNGFVNYQELPKLIKDNTCLLSIHYVNSEIGIIQPISEISNFLKDINQKREIKIFFHTDASQAPLTEEISVKKLGVDLMTLSGHKIYGPKGAACLYKKANVVLEKLISGSEQEFDLRSGTENVPLIVGFTKALELAVHFREEIRKHLLKIRNYFIYFLEKSKIDFQLNGNIEKSTPKILNIYFPQKTAQELFLYLDQNNIFVSIGMACKSRAVLPNEVVYKIYPERAKNSLRFSFGRETKIRDINYVVEKLKDFL